MPKINQFGWIPDKKDDRDYQYSRLLEPLAKEVPPEGSVISLFPPAYQQGNLGSCVWFATKALMAAAYVKQSFIDPDLSALFGYYCTRELENSIYEDAGCSPRDAMKVAVNIGVCAEMFWPYVVDKFTYKPTPQCYIDALNHKITNYYSIEANLSLLKNCIADGYPFSAGIVVYENFPMDTTTGDVPMPEGQAIGGHDTVIVGYSDYTKKFTFRNSWGEWGNHGYGTISYDYITDISLASDFWTIRMMENIGTSNSNSGCSNLLATISKWFNGK